MACTQKVRETLLKLDSVQEVAVDFETKLATVKAKAGSELARDTVESALKGAGFELSAFELVKAQ